MPRSYSYHSLSVHHPVTTNIPSLNCMSHFAHLPLTALLPPVHRLFPCHSLSVHRSFTSHSLFVHRPFTDCSTPVHRLFNTRSPTINRLYTAIHRQTNQWLCLWLSTAKAFVPVETLFPFSCLVCQLLFHLFFDQRPRNKRLKYTRLSL